MLKLNHEVAEFLEKWGALFTYIFIGLVGKFGYDIVTRKKLSAWYVFGTGCVGICIGYLSFMLCRSRQAWNPGIVVPVATLVSRDIMLFITMVDYVSVLKILTGKSTKEKP